jgi:LacI family transcriptional regulator
LIILPKFDSAENSQKVFFEKGYEEMQKLLTRRALPDAIFFATDLSAFGAIKALEEAHLKVPDDISIVGFDDENPAFYNFRGSRITTVRQPLLEAGYRGIQRLIQSVEHPETPRERTLLKTELVLRKSARTRRGS